MRPAWLRQHLAALSVLLACTVLFGILYPLVVFGIAQLPGLRQNAQGSILRTRQAGPVGSRLIGQSFTGSGGMLLPQYFQSRPSAAGSGYDPTSTSASNLGPEDVVDAGGRRSLLTQVCARSKAIGEREHVDGSRPYCTPSGVGAVLAVFGTPTAVARVVSVNEACPARPFLATYRGVPVMCARPDADYSAGVVLPVRGNAQVAPAVPPDAVTSSGSGLDPNISPAYARLQIPRVAASRGMSVRQVSTLVAQHTTGRALGFLGEPAVNVLELNVALDRVRPMRP